MKVKCSFYILIVFFISVQQTRRRISKKIATHTIKHTLVLTMYIRIYVFISVFAFMHLHELYNSYVGGVLFMNL